MNRGLKTVFFRSVIKSSSKLRLPKCLSIDQRIQQKSLPYIFVYIKGMKKAFEQGVSLPNANYHIKTNHNFKYSFLFVSI